MAFDGIICYRRNDESGIPSGVYVARLIQENLQKNGLKPYLDVEDGELLFVIQIPMIDTSLF